MMLNEFFSFIHLVEMDKLNITIMFHIVKRRWIAVAIEFQCNVHQFQWNEWRRERWQTREIIYWKCGNSTIRKLHETYPNRENNKFVRNEAFQIPIIVIQYVCLWLIILYFFSGAWPEWFRRVCSGLPNL